MAKWVLLSFIAVLMLLVACGGGSDEILEGEQVPKSRATATPFPAAAPTPAAAPAVASAQRVPADQDMRNSARIEFGMEPPVPKISGALPQMPGNLEISQRKVISVASVSIEVEAVETAITEVRVTAEGLGGFVEQLSSSGEPERAQAHVTIRIPQAQFFPALERIEALGNVRDRMVGSEDVSEQFIDLQARLKSSLREEQSLLSLLGKTETVSEILAIERELSRVRSDIERFQGQLNFLERRVELATINVSLFPPRQDLGEPPSGALTIEVRDVVESVAVVKKLLLSLNGSLDSVFLSVNDGNESAEVSLRVFSPDFERAFANLERQGTVSSKELREGTSPPDTDAPEDPDAHINVSFVGETGSSNTALIVSIAAPIGGVALASLLGFLFYLTYRMGGRRARQR